MNGIIKWGIIGLGNVGSKLAHSLLRNNFNLTVRDLDLNLTKSKNNVIRLVLEYQN